MKKKLTLSVLSLISLFSISPLFAMEVESMKIEAPEEIQYPIHLPYQQEIHDSPEFRRGLKETLAQTLEIDPGKITITAIENCPSPRGPRSVVIDHYLRPQQENAN